VLHIDAFGLNGVDGVAATAPPITAPAGRLTFTGVFVAVLVAAGARFSAPTFWTGFMFSIALIGFIRALLGVFVDAGFSTALFSMK
jgi:hypothetical protein